MIPRELEAQILRLSRVECWPVGTIASQLGLHHEVVERVLSRGGMPRAPRVRPSMVDPYLPFILEQWKRYPRLTASRLYRMCRERGYTGHPDHFRHVVARHRPRRAAEAYLRLRTLIGEQAQVDWAHFGTCEIGRAKRALVGVVILLSWSRAIFLRFFHGMATEHFLRAHVEAFTRWTGCPRVCLYDNLKSAVLERYRDAIRFNPLLIDFASHYRFEPRPVAPARGNEKGRVERSIRFVRADFFLACRFRDLADLNAQADLWCEGAALDRPWVEDPARSVREALSDERARLLPLPDAPFPVDERREVRVGKTPYARFDRNDYSVPHTSVRRTLTVLASPEVVRIFDGTSEVARHPRSYDRGRQIEDPVHIAALVESKRQARRHSGLDRLAHAAPSSVILLERLAERGQSVRTATLRLIRLLDTYGAAPLECALGEILERDVLHLHAVQQMLEQSHAARGLPPATPLSLPDDPRLRDLDVRPHALSGYDAIAEDFTDDPTEEGGDDADSHCDA